MDRDEPMHQPAVPGFPGVIGTFMGRDAVSLAAAYVGLQPNDSVLLPAYTCQDVLRRFIGTNDVVFYDVGPDLAIDPDQVRIKLGGRKLRMMLITNYFGFLQPYRHEIKEICGDRGTWLIEDCAHSLLTEGSGETGDFAVYSFRKILPVPDGGGLKVNREVRRPPVNFYPRIYSDSLSFLAIAKSALNIHIAALSRDGVASHTAEFLPNTTSSKGDGRVLPLSYFARRSMCRVSVAEVVRRRREDFQFWHELTAKRASIVPVFDDLPAGVCPLGFPIRVEDRSSIERRARRAGIVLQVHWRLDTRLGAECGTSHRLSAQMLTLPLYPAIQETQREKLAEIVVA